MLPNAFINQKRAPNQEQLASALGPAKMIWDHIVAELVQEEKLDGQEWKSYSIKHGWSLHLTSKKRNIVYLSPCLGSFQIMFILGEKAMKTVRSCRWPQKIQKIIAEAPRYPEGTGIRIEGVGSRDIPSIKKLAKIKMQK